MKQKIEQALINTAEIDEAIERILEFYNNTPEKFLVCG
jgi:hypothetical protein